MRTNHNRPCESLRDPINLVLSQAIRLHHPKEGELWDTIRRLQRFFFTASAVPLAITFLIANSVMALENEVWISPIGPAVTNVNTNSVVYGNITYPAYLVGTPTYPFRCPDAASLNYVLTEVLTNTNLTIHFMAGTFEVPSNCIVALSGWKLRGAGIGNTILQLQAGTPAPGGDIAVIQQINQYATGTEVSDMTIDCNLQNQTGANAISAVQLMGSESRISRVKAINWGTDSAYECFVLYIYSAAYGTELSTNCIIEDCVVTQPATQSGTGGASAISVFTQGPSGPMLVPGAVLRNNMVYGVATGGTGQPAHITGYGPGGDITHNYAFNLTGPSACGIYVDSYNGRDWLYEDNVFDNVTYGVDINYGSSWGGDECCDEE